MNDKGILTETQHHCRKKIGQSVQCRPTFPFFSACKMRLSRPAACSSSVGIPEKDGQETVTSDAQTVAYYQKLSHLHTELLKASKFI